jgi:hypothetical protein
MVSRAIRGLRVLLVLAACVQPAAALASDSTVGSGSPAAAEVRKLPGGAVVRMSPGARVTFGRPIRLQLVPTGGAKTLTHTVKLISGRIEVDLPASKTPTTAVMIHAPNKISAVAKGGHSVVIAAPKRVTVAAVSGEMLVASGNDWRTIGSGIVREFGPGGAPADHAVIAAPKLSLSAPIAFRLGATSTAAHATATPVARATGYDFGIWQVKGNERVLLRRLAAHENKVELPPLDAGSYGVTARAVEASGLESPDSPLSDFRVVAAELPEGAKLADGTILLRPHQRVALSGTQGIEISYGRAPQFIPAPSSIGLIRGQPTLIRLRSAGSTNELSLSLEPRTLRADIQIGPRRARWPHDAISVSVRLTDAHGRPIAASSDVKAVVHVNVTPVSLEWKRNQNVLTTVVPRPKEAGPWVVRVEILDDTGTIVGRDFLEVAKDERRAQR